MGTGEGQGLRRTTSVRSRESGRDGTTLNGVTGLRRERTAVQRTDGLPSDSSGWVLRRGRVLSRADDKCRTQGREVVVEVQDSPAPELWDEVDRSVESHGRQPCRQVQGGKTRVCCNLRQVPQLASQHCTCLMRGVVSAYPHHPHFRSELWGSPGLSRDSFKDRTIPNTKVRFCSTLLYCLGQTSNTPAPLEATYCSPSTQPNAIPFSISFGAASLWRKADNWIVVLHPNRHQNHHNVS